MARGTRAGPVSDRSWSLAFRSSTALLMGLGGAGLWFEGFRNGLMTEALAERIVGRSVDELSAAWPVAQSYFLDLGDEALELVNASRLGLRPTRCSGRDGPAACTAMAAMTRHNPLFMAILCAASTQPEDAARTWKTRTNRTHTQRAPWGREHVGLAIRAPDGSGRSRGASRLDRDHLSTQHAAMEPATDELGRRLTRTELARTAAVEEAFVTRLVDLAILAPDAHGHLPGDLYRVRFAALAAASGVSLDDLATSLAAGVVRMGDVDLLFPEPVETSQTTHAQLAVDLGVDDDLLRRIRLAAGLAARRPEHPVQRDEERILRLIVQLSRGFGDTETSIRIARNYGERIQRIVVSAVGAYEELVYAPLIDSMPTIDAATRRMTSEEGRSLIEMAERLLTATHRRHMEAALLAMWVRTTEAQMARHGVTETLPERLPAIAFADLSGFTELTDREGDEVGIWLASQLVAEVEVTAAAHGSHIVKLLGDGVMLHSSDPGSLIDAAVELVERLPKAGLPPAHVGIHCGPLIERDGDYFGRTVNVAARIAAEASPGDVLVSEAVARRASPDLHLTELPAVHLRGVSEPMILFRTQRR